MKRIVHILLFTNSVAGIVGHDYEIGVQDDADGVVTFFHSYGPHSYGRDGKPTESAEDVIRGGVQKRVNNGAEIDSDWFESGLKNLEWPSRWLARSA